MSKSPSIPPRLSMDELRALRLRAQGLHPRLPPGSLLAAVQTVCGVNAQLPSAMELSLRARVEAITNEEIEKMRVEARAVVRTWCMRGTLHLLAADDLDWLLSSISPAEMRAGWRRLEKRAGLARPHADQVLEDAWQTLKASSPLRRSDLMAALAKKHGAGVQSAAAGLVHLSGILGRACFGPDAGAKPTYVDLQSWLGREVYVSFKPEYARLARRYLQGYGPAAPHDLAAWWGMGLNEAKVAWAQLREELVELDVEGKPAWLLRSQASALEEFPHPNQSVCLLPAFDTYLLGYKNRDFAVPREVQDRVFHGGEIVPTILAGGSAIGTWRYEQRGRQMRITATPFTSFTPDRRERIAAEAEDIGRFYGLRVVLDW